MSFEQVLQVANALVSAKSGRYLNDVETAILMGAWKNQTYEQIADESGYSISYLTRDVGPKLWKLLSQALGETVSKTNFQAALERSKHKAILEQPIQVEAPSIHLATTVPPVPFPTTHSPLLDRRCDWGESTDVSLFYGRNQELATLQQWIWQDRCRLIFCLGMGGIGKTSLTVKLAREIDTQFDCVIWRSLRNEPSLKTLLSSLVAFVSNQQDCEPELDRLMHWLRTSRCLIVLDNMETLLQAGDRAGYFRPGYEDYGDLLRAIGETSHQSCVVFTSREKPAELAALEGMELAVRTMRLGGSLEASQGLIAAKGLLGSPEQQHQLCQLYGCNPLAVKIVATSIQDLFDGDIAAFLEQDATVFSGVHRLLDQQCERCSRLERTIMYWLAINREWTSIAELAADIVPLVSRADLLEALESLSWRSLIEKQAGCYTQQPVVMEYTTSQLIDEICVEVLRTTHTRQPGSQSRLSLLQRHALLKSQGKDYIRDTQVRQILKPLLDKLTVILGSAQNVASQLTQLLSKLQQDIPIE
ncbi:MAG TPA: NB-ARC domain-containing protein, partial [Allocoleopsis sp.]